MLQVRRVRLQEFRSYPEVDPIAFALWGMPPICRADEPTARDGGLGDLELPREVSTAQAAEILGVSKDTVLKLKSAGLLEYRNTAPPGSSRPVYAFTLRSVMELRTGYERDAPTPRLPSERPRRTAKGKRKYKHLDTGS